MLSIRILTNNDIPKIEEMKQDFNIFRVVDTKKGKLEMVEFFNKDGVFRGFGRDTKAAYKRAKRAVMKYYKNK
ncbi:MULTISPECIES: hypothetical protein [Malaciobacter]|jgi:hypothetical protein|uniref:GNAT family N-acetyltransferase n=2 Tax=Malaciobacter TaxID=2321114 RepID=A0AB36ZW72_9BACT|nr:MULTISPECIES: hypothetical protein [Malaciobacter]PHO09537.1 hypothetical protein CPG37_08525 [Malaciobacter canalis]PPK61385.1 hypothetical protein B0F89_11030 [Malaciobacter marinus]QEE31602.1 hypothetical protein ACAN_0065 [Malaciobacter canalis]SKB45743.1 hypothetical protein SAMN06295997_11330 [Malaciobacter marinus]